MSDLIDRQVVIDMLATMQGRCTSKAALIQNSKIWQQIKDLPSAQPDVHDKKVGEWRKEDRGGVEYTAVCSECGYATFWSDAETYNFCPICGSDMRGDGE